MAKEQVSHTAHKWQDEVTKAGLSGIHASTISTILKLTEQALAGKQGKLSAADVENAFKNQTLFFENAVVREEIYKLNAIRIAASNEFE
jgi:hypothetical protein